MSSYSLACKVLVVRFQFVWTFGLNFKVSTVGLGYHFQHYSDATIYGSDSRGVDLHMFELAYRF